MQTVLLVFFHRPTWSKRPVRTSNFLCSLSSWFYAKRPSPVYNYASNSPNSRSRPSKTSAVGATTVTQWRMTESMTTLNSVGERGSTWVTPWYPLNRIPKYPPDLATMVSQSQYVERVRVVLGPALYTRSYTNICEKLISYLK